LAFWGIFLPRYCDQKFGILKEQDNVLYVLTVGASKSYNTTPRTKLPRWLFQELESITKNENALASKLFVTLPQHHIMHELCRLSLVPHLSKNQDREVVTETLAVEACCDYVTRGNLVFQIDFMDTLADCLHVDQLISNMSRTLSNTSVPLADKVVSVAPWNTK